MHPDLLALHQLAHAEHRAEVELGWSRQRFFVGVNAALLAAGCALVSSPPMAVLPVLALGAVLSLVGVLVVARSHGRTRRTRDELDAAARRAGVEGPAVTGGQRVRQWEGAQRAVPGRDAAGGRADGVRSPRRRGGGGVARATAAVAWQCP